MNYFRGRIGRHLRGVLSISQDETALQVHLRNATMFFRSKLRQS
jgi:hypothetical protein